MNYFTIVESLKNPETRVYFSEVKDDVVNLKIAQVHGTELDQINIEIDRQQLAELGMLLFTLAGKDYDASSILELLDGFGLTSDILKEIV